MSDLFAQLPGCCTSVHSVRRSRILNSDWLSDRVRNWARLLAWAVYDRISLKHRIDAGAPPIPVGGPTNDLIAVVVGIVAYLALAFAFHPVVIGVPVFGV